MKPRTGHSCLLIRLTTSPETLFDSARESAVHGDDSHADGSTRGVSRTLRVLVCERDAPRLANATGRPRARVETRPADARRDGPETDRYRAGFPLCREARSFTARRMSPLFPETGPRSLRRVRHRATLAHPGTERSTPPSRLALMTTMIVESDMNTAPTAGERRTPSGARRVSPGARAGRPVVCDDHGPRECPRLVVPAGLRVGLETGPRVRTGRMSSDSRGDPVAGRGVCGPVGHATPPGRCLATSLSGCRSASTQTSSSSASRIIVLIHVVRTLQRKRSRSTATEKNTRYVIKMCHKWGDVCRLTRVLTT